MLRPTRRGPPGGAKKADPNFVSFNNLGSKSLLLDLPPELRNAVYDYVAGTVATIKVRKNKPEQHPLAYTSRQIQNEFLPVFERDGPANASTIITEIADLDFRTLVIFLNKLPLPAGEQRQTLSITITISLTRSGVAQIALFGR